MKNLIILLSLITTIINGQTSTYTLNTNTDFSDFTIGGTPNNGTTVIQSSNFAPLTFTLPINCYKTFVSPTYTASTILDSVVVTFTTVATLSITAIELDHLPGLSFPTYYPTNSTVRFVYYNTNSVTIQTLTILSNQPNPQGKFSIFDLNVIGYKTLTSGLNEQNNVFSNFYIYKNIVYNNDKQNKEMRLEVYDLSGRQLINKNFDNENKLEFNSGIYMLRIADKRNATLAYRKIVVE